MKASLRQRLLIAVGISAGLLASMNLFAQEAKISNTSEQQYTINSEADYLTVVKSISDLSSSLYSAHQKYPSLTYAHVFDSNGILMGFTVTGVPQSSVADQISACLMELEALGKAVNTMNLDYLPESKNDKLTSRVSKKKAMKSMEQSEPAEMHASAPNPTELTASSK